MLGIDESFAHKNCFIPIESSPRLISNHKILKVYERYDMNFERYGVERDALMYTKV